LSAIESIGSNSARTSRRDGEGLVIEPVRKRRLVALLKAMKPLAEDFPEIDDPVPANVL